MNKIPIPICFLTVILLRVHEDWRVGTKNFILAFFFIENQSCTQQDTINDEHKVIRNKYIFKNTKSHRKLPVTVEERGLPGFPKRRGNYRATQRNSPEYLFLHMKTGHQLIKSFRAVSFPLGNAAGFPHYLHLIFRRSLLSFFFSSLSLSLVPKASRRLAGLSAACVGGKGVSLNGSC